MRHSRTKREKGRKESVDMTLFKNQEKHISGYHRSLFLYKLLNTYAEDINVTYENPPRISQN